MRRAKLDKIDLRILADLQADGRMTNVDLAARAGISAPPCLRRVRALEEAGYIKGYHADVNPEALGYGVTIFAHDEPVLDYTPPRPIPPKLLVPSQYENPETHRISPFTVCLMYGDILP